MKNPYIILAGALFLVLACNPGSQKEKQTETEASAHSMTFVKVSQVEERIKTYIKRKAEQNDGFFQVQYKDEDLRTKLVRVHTEYLSNVGPKSLFACVDLADVSGDVYDVDFFLSGDPGSMDVTQTVIHRRNGKPFYAWKQREDNTWERVAVEDASRQLLGVIEGKDSFEFHYEAEIPEIKGKARMWIPIARSDAYQTVEVKSLRAPGQRMMLDDEENNNEILYLELGPEDSNAVINIVYDVTRLEKAPFAEEHPDTARFLAPNQLIPVGGRFLRIAEEAIGEKRSDNKIVQARALYDYVIDHMKYAKVGEYGHGDAVYACDTRTGNCTEFHSFFISLARSVGIPARFAVGASIPSERNDGGIEGYHCWAEFYAEGKWWPVDISEGNKYTALATYYFGRHPANRIEFTRGRDLKVARAPASGPINFLAYPLLEINGEPIRVETRFSFVRSR